MKQTPTTSTRASRRHYRSKYPNLLVWRLALNLNQRDAAKILGMTQSKYSRLERRVATIVGAEAKHVIDRAGVPLEVLVGLAS